MDISKQLCNWCGEEEGKGLFAMMKHRCIKNTTIYRPASLTLRKLINAISGINPLKSFIELIEFKHFSPYIKNNENTHPLDEFLYEKAREFELKQMKRIIKLYSLEEEFDSKY